LNPKLECEGSNAGSETKELAEVQLEVLEAFPFLLGKPGGGRIEALVEAWVNLRHMKIIV
jgi:hypothetical protein